MIVRLLALPGIVDFDEGTYYEGDPGIKIYLSLLENPRWKCLSDSEKIQIITMWIIASDTDGLVSDDPVYLQKQCMSDKPIDLSRFIGLGLIEKLDDEEGII